MSPIFRKDRDKIFLKKCTLGGTEQEWPLSLFAIDIYSNRRGRGRMRRGKRRSGEREGMRKAHKVVTCGYNLENFFPQMEMNRLKRR